MGRAAMVAVLVSGCATGGGGGGPGDGGSAGGAVGPAAVPSDRLLPLDAAARRWVDSTLASMDPRARAAHLVMPWTSGRYVPVDSDEWRTLESWVDAGVGGIVVSIGPPVALADKLNRLQARADVPLLIATDMERGPGQRLEGGVVLPYGMDMGGGSDFPPVMAVGATGDPALAYEVGRATAAEARAVGIHLDFAPVVDVNNNPENPIINTRSYGADPARVARFAAAHVRGLQENGLLATAKHFPGHGDTSGDTHLELQVLRIDAARADSTELVPFRAAVAEGVSAVMSAHIAFPALTDDPSRPATLSGRMLDSLLVGELGFQGLVVTDALNMGAIVRGYGPVESALLALEAGADILLMPLDVAAVVDGIVAAMESGRVAPERVDRSVRKILEAKARVGLHRRRTVDVAAVADVVGSDAHEALADRIAERSITLVRDRDGLVPLATTPDARVLAITYADDISPFAAADLHRVLAPAIPGLERVRLDAPVPASVLDSVTAAAEAADLVIFVADVGVRSGKGSVAVEPAVAEAVRRVAATRPVAMVSLGNPYILQQIPEVGTYLLAWGSGRASQEAAARALLGRAPITGQLPIPIPPLHEAGAGLERAAVPGADAGGQAGGQAGAGAGADNGAGGVQAGVAGLRLDADALASLGGAIEGAIRAGVTPGAAVAAGRVGSPVWTAAFGATDRAAGAPAVTDSTLYDLASLTKVVGTTSAIMLLVDRGRIELDAPLSRYLEAWPRGGWRDSVTIRRLLTHRAGLPPFVRFWHPSEGGRRGLDAVVSAIAAVEPVDRPGARTVYSDLGFILLGATAEAVSGERLDAFLDRELWTPLGMHDTGYNPRPERMAGVWAEAVEAETAADADAAAGGDEARGRASSFTGSEPWWPLEGIAPTEVDTVYRHAHVHGVVHDENAYAIGGVSGHAGLFSTARDLARFARMLMRGGVGPDGERLVGAETVAAFTTRDAAGDRALGWDAAPGGAGIAAALSPESWGHTGFTGTSLWMDPARELFVVLLTNRVNPTRSGPSVTPLRRAVHRWAAEAADRADRAGAGDAPGPG